MVTYFFLAAPKSAVGINHTVFKPVQVFITHLFQSMRLFYQNRVAQSKLTRHGLVLTPEMLVTAYFSPPFRKRDHNHMKFPAKTSAWKVSCHLHLEVSHFPIVPVVVFFLRAQFETQVQRCTTFENFPSSQRKSTFTWLRYSTKFFHFPYPCEKPRLK